MKIDPNDPRWTAYALGELEDEQDRAEIEEMLQHSAEARQLLEEIRHTADLLSSELKMEYSITLPDEQRQRILSQAGADRSWISAKLAWTAAGGLAAAAVLVMMLVIGNPLKKEKSLAQLNQRNLATPEFQARNNIPDAILEGPEPKTQSETLPAEQVGDVPSSSVQTKAQPAQKPLQTAVPASSDAEKTTATIDIAQKARIDARNEGDSVQTSLTVDGKEVAVEPGKEARSTMLQSASKDAAGGLIPGAVVAGNIQNLKTETEEFYFASRASLQESGSSAGNTKPAARQGGTADRIFAQEPDFIHDGSRHSQFNTEAYDYIAENPFLDVIQNPLSTFSIDVDTAAYSNMRRFLNQGLLPPKDAVRIEELINYFDYEYEAPKDGEPFAAHMEITEAPWNPEHRLLRIGLKGREIANVSRPASNLVFLLDVSGSMKTFDKLPLVKDSLRMLIDQLDERDTVSIVVYAGASGLVLPATSGDHREALRAAVDRLEAGGSTNGGSGIQLAYKTARRNFLPQGVNRVILATDGDFNVGITNRGDLTRLIEEEAEKGIFLTVLGFGMGNYKDSTLELLADKGNGNYAYVDTHNEARKVLVEQMSSTLVTIAKDVKIQIEFNPEKVGAYRLIGYENRILNKEDFNDDSKDAGEIGAGHSVTVLYELVPAGLSAPTRKVDPLIYQEAKSLSRAAASGQILTLKLRYKAPEAESSTLSEFTLTDSGGAFNQASSDFRFAAAVAAFGMVLRDSPHKGHATLESALDWAKAGRGSDRHGYREEFIRLIHRAISIGLP